MTRMDGIKVIVVEDEQNTRTAVNYIISKKGYECVLTDNGQEALEIIFDAHLSNSPFDLIICDLAMPVMSGEELIIALNKRKIDIPVLVITGVADREAIVRLLRLGVREFIDKPFEREEFETRVDNVLRFQIGDDNSRTRLERLARMGEFAMASIHDIGNMICASIGFMGLIVSDMTPDNPLYPNIARAFAATKHTSTICREFMDLRSNAFREQKTLTDINVPVKRVIRILSDILPETIQMKTNVHFEPLLYNVDTWRFQHALVNLGINAVDAMPDGGVLEFSSGKMSGTDGQSGEFIFVDVKDSGIGMTSDIACSALEDGFTTRPGGHGFGLSSIRRIVNNHNGHLEIRSSPGCGTTFRLLFPIPGV
jgi:signal transduction histidine kinase